MAVRQPVEFGERLPFDVEFQKSLLRLMTEDETFGSAAIQYLEPKYFESEILGWVYGVLSRFHVEHGRLPSMHAVLQETRNIDPTIRTLYSAMVEQIREASLRDTDWLKDRTLDFVKRNIFVRAFAEGRELYNAKKTAQAYDLMMDRMDAISRVKWEADSESWFYATLPQRQADRVLHNPEDQAIPTGFPSIDLVLDGGLHPGELGIWMAYPKIGKSTLLVSLGLEATRRRFKVFHVILEGSQRLIENRYDTAFTGEAYREVKAGRMTPETYGYALKDYQMMRDCLVLRSFVDDWDVSALHIDASLRKLKRDSGWVPQMVVIDYADLMTGRDKRYYKSETDSQRAAYRDVKRLSGRGYAVWTAAQAQRPRADKLEEKHLLYSSSVADTYEKVRAGDFLGSLNQTATEREMKLLRAYNELYRDNAAGTVVYLNADYSTMQISENSALTMEEAQKKGQPKSSQDSSNGNRRSRQMEAF